MMTPTHILVGGALFSRPLSAGSNIAILAGALTPDLSIYVLYGWAKFIADIPSRVVWSQIYWQEPWQMLSAISNSIPLYTAILMLAVIGRVRWLVMFAAAALSHLALDLPFHNSDAHKHFWPITDYRFNSPLSYWNSNHFGDYVRIAEFGIGLICILVIWRRFNALWVKCAMAVLLASYIAVPLYFSLSLG